MKLDKLYCVNKYPTDQWEGEYWKLTYQTYSFEACFKILKEIYADERSVDVFYSNIKTNPFLKMLAREDIK